MVKSLFNKITVGLAYHKKLDLDKQTLRSAGIGILIYDERWGSLFSKSKKPPKVVKAENALKNRIEEKKRLLGESDNNKSEKQVKLGRILELTGKAFDEEDETARAEIADCEVRVREINVLEQQTVNRVGVLEGEISKINFALLENAVSFLYGYMKKSRTRVAELNSQIDDMRETIKDRISERAELEEAIAGTYNFLHGLLGMEQIEPIDDHYENTADRQA